MDLPTHDTKNSVTPVYPREKTTWSLICKLHHVIKFFWTCASLETGSFDIFLSLLFSEIQNMVWKFEGLESLLPPLPLHPGNNGTTLACGKSHPCVCSLYNYNPKAALIYLTIEILKKTLMHSYVNLFYRLLRSLLLLIWL